MYPGFPLRVNLRGVSLPIWHSQHLADDPGTKIFHLDVDPLKQQMPRM
jgi:hypothetical protein